MSGRARKSAGTRPLESQLAPLLAVVNALSNPTATIAPAGVAYTLGLSEKEAAKLIDEAMAASEGGEVAGSSVLPLAQDEEGELFIAPTAGGTSMAAQRMTAAQAQATEELLDTLGIDDAAFDGIRPALARVLYPADYTPRPLPEEAGGPQLPLELTCCLDAIACHQGLTFDYEGQRGGTSSRRVEPLSLGLYAGDFTLVALDVDLLEQAERQRHAADPLTCRRFFTVRAMRNLAAVPLTAHHDELKAVPWEAGNSWARLYFRDAALFDASTDWMWSRRVPYAELSATERKRVGRKGCAVDVCLFAGSPYLARLIVSCGGLCTTDHPEVRAQVQRLLGELP